VILSWLKKINNLCHTLYAVGIFKGKEAGLRAARAAFQEMDTDKRRAVFMADKP
jgi:hypothetical protein